MAANELSTIQIIAHVFGIWGGILSSCLALIQFLSGRPRVHLRRDEYNEKEFLEVRVVNDANYPITITPVCTFPKEAKFTAKEERTVDVVRAAIGRTLSYSIPPKSTAVLTLILGSDDTDLSIKIKWRKENSLRLPTFPIYVRRKKAEIHELRSAVQMKDS